MSVTIDSCHGANLSTWDPLTWFQEIGKIQNAFPLSTDFFSLFIRNYYIWFNEKYHIYVSHSHPLHLSLKRKWYANSVWTVLIQPQRDISLINLNQGREHKSHEIHFFFFNLIGSFVPWFANLPDLVVAPLTIPQTVQTSLRNSVQKKYSLVHIFSFRPEDFWASLRGICRNTFVPLGWISWVRRYSEGKLQ